MDAINHCTNVMLSTHPISILIFTNHLFVSVVVCPICQDELVWLGGCILMTRFCLHLAHRECFEAYRKTTPSYKKMLCPYCREESHLSGTGGDKSDVNTARNPVTLEELDHPDYYGEENMWEPTNLDYLTWEEREWLERENAIY